jgi:hypothetical protein
MTSTVKGVTARKLHQCGICRGWVIMPGHRYLRHVEFPGDINSSGRPWVGRECIDCAVAVSESSTVDDPLMLAGACGTFCHGVTPCALDGDHTGEHSCREDTPRYSLVVVCNDEREPDGKRCTGRVRYEYGDDQAACDTCGGWRGRKATR